MCVADKILPLAGGIRPRVPAPTGAGRTRGKAGDNRKTAKRMSTEIRGVVTRATGSWYDVLHEGRTIACRIRGRIRLKGVRSTNPGRRGRRGGLHRRRRRRVGDRTHPAAPQLHHPARLEPLERVAHHRREHRSGTARGHALATRDGPRIPRPLSGDVRSLQDPRDDPAGQIRPRCGRPRSRGGLPRHLRKRGATASSTSRRSTARGSTRCVRSSPAARRSWRATRASASRRSSAHSNPDWRCAREASRRATAKDGIRPPSRPCTPSRAAGS